jgi:LPXTG-motif cell wall-anchored protein
VGNDGKFNGWENVPTGTGNGGAITYNDWATFDDSHEVILTSDGDGFFKVIGLDDGTYKLREIQAPNGYNLLENDVELVITATTANGQAWNSGIATDALTRLTIAVDNGAAQNGDLDTGIVNVTVENNQGATLPETGGMGTTLFYIIGGLLVVGAGVLLVVRIRMKAHNE